MQTGRLAVQRFLGRIRLTCSKRARRLVRLAWGWGELGAGAANKAGEVRTGAAGAGLWAG